jgi:uncharacterized protein YdeI (BOF family)
MNSFGNFDLEKNLSKNAARKGQAFTATRKVSTLNIKREVQIIDDITHHDFVFSDGCGEISTQLAKEIASMYGVCF